MFPLTVVVVFSLKIARNNTGRNLLEFDTNPITNFKMADKMAPMKHYNWLLLSHLLI